MTALTTSTLTDRLRALPIGARTTWLYDHWQRRWAVLRLSHNLYEASLNGKAQRGSAGYIAELMEECSDV